MSLGRSSLRDPWKIPSRKIEPVAKVVTDSEDIASIDEEVAAMQNKKKGSVEVAKFVTDSEDSTSTMLLHGEDVSPHVKENASKMDESLSVVSGFEIITCEFSSQNSFESLKGTPGVTLQTLTENYLSKRPARKVVIQERNFYFL